MVRTRSLSRALTGVGSASSRSVRPDAVLQLLIGPETAIVAQTASQLQTGTQTSSNVAASLSNPTILYISVSMGLACALSCSAEAADIGSVVHCMDASQRSLRAPLTCARLLPYHRAIVPLETLLTCSGWPVQPGDHPRAVALRRRLIPPRRHLGRRAVPWRHRRSWSRRVHGASLESAALASLPIDRSDILDRRLAVECRKRSRSFSRA